MLAPNYHRQQTKRERGISLSRMSSQQKISHFTNRQFHQPLNQSFQCHEPKSHIFHQQHNFNSSTVLKEHNQNRLSNMPQRQKTHRQYQQKLHTNSHQHSRKGSILNKDSKQNIITNSSFHMGQTLCQQAQSIHQMIDLLVEYEKQCQKQMDLQSAQQARKRINQLKIEQINTRRKQLEVEGKQYVLKTRRQGQVEKRKFYQFWDDKILQARQALKQIEQKHMEEQHKQLAQYQRCVYSQPFPSIKYSSKALQTRRNLTQLIKSRKYKQAEHLKQLLAKKQVEEQEKWIQVCHEKKLMKIKQFKKKQKIELEAFRLKLNSSFNELLTEKQKQQQRMSKKMKKMQVQAKKMPPAIVKAKKDLLNQSKANIQNENYLF